MGNKKHKTADPSEGRQQAATARDHRAIDIPPSDDTDAVQRLKERITELEARCMEAEKSRNRSDGPRVADPLARMTVDTTGTIREINHAAAGLLGKDADGLRGCDFAALMPSDVGADFRKCLSRIARVASRCSCDLDLNRSDGSRVLVHIEAQPLPNESGTVSEVEISLTEISERLGLRTTGSQSREVYRALIHNSPDVILRLDRELRLLYANPALRTSLGIDPEASLGKSIRDIGLPEQLVEGCEHDIRGVLDTGRRLRKEVEFDGPAGHTALDCQIVPETGTVGMGETVIIAARDISEIRRLQDIVSRAERLEAASGIAGQVAHDFNNLLGPLVAYPMLIREKLTDDPETLRYLDDMESAAESMALINQQLLTLGGRGHYSLEPLNINDVVRRALDQMPPTAHSVSTKTELDEGLMAITGGAAQLSRALLNLLANAQDAMKGAGQLTVRTENFYVDALADRFERVPRGEFVKVTVSDSGCGIPEEHVSRVFDPFFTTKTTDRVRGSGLGLSVVRGVVKDHRGYIDLESEPGRGTSVYLYFPALRQRPEPAPSDDIPGGVEKVLVIDDDEMQRGVSLTLLRKLGYEATAVESGEKAVELLRESPQDLLILDMVMPPGIDGFETYRRALEVNSKQKAILVSGYAGSARAQETLRLGAGAYVQKPLTLKSLAFSIRSELDRQPDSDSSTSRD